MYVILMLRHYVLVYCSSVCRSPSESCGGMFDSSSSSCPHQGAVKKCGGCKGSGVEVSVFFCAVLCHHGLDVAS